MERQKTTLVKPHEAKRAWVIVDLQDKVVGRAASAIADVLRGKHKADFTPHVDNGDFVVAIRTRSRFRTLHRRGSCFRIPGRDFLEWESFGPEVPPPTSFNAACRACFNTQTVAPHAAGDDSASTGSSSS